MPTLQNKQLQIHLDLPNQGYRGSRFDWSGKLTSISFEGTKLTTSESHSEPNATFLGKGLYNEFGIDYALGFEACKIGGWFHKIGVGLLRKDSETYDFIKPYEVKPCEFKIQLHDQKSLTFICASSLTNGYAYVLRKQYTLKDNTLAISYVLENNGEKEILTDEYCHNFMAFGEKPIGPSYQLSFPFAMKPESFGETVNPNNCVTLGTSSISFNQKPSSDFFFSDLSGNEEVESNWTLTDQDRNLSVSEFTDFQTSKINLWGCGHVISPELFRKIKLSPGETDVWKRTYLFSKNS